MATQELSTYEPEMTKQLSYKKDESYKFIQLPFIGHEHHRDGKTGYWDVPLTGGYGGGNETGEALAYLYMKYLRETKGEYNSGTLQHIIFSMAELLNTSIVIYISRTSMLISRTSALAIIKT